MNWNESKIIKSCNDFHERKIFEALIIRGFDETSLLNRDKGHDINNIWSTVIEKYA